MYVKKAEQIFTKMFGLKSDLKGRENRQTDR